MFNTGSGTATPWGRSQGTTNRIAVGLCQYSTSGHGGIAVSFSLSQRMHPWARAEGMRYGGRLWYEEDCAWAIPIYDLYDKVPGIVRHFLARGITNAKETAEATLRQYYPDCPLLPGKETT